MHVIVIDKIYQILQMIDQLVECIWGSSLLFYQSRERLIKQQVSGFLKLVLMKIKGSLRTMQYEFLDYFRVSI